MCRIIPRENRIAIHTADVYTQTRLRICRPSCKHVIQKIIPFILLQWKRHACADDNKPTIDNWGPFLNCMYNLWLHVHNFIFVSPIHLQAWRHVSWPIIGLMTSSLSPSLFLQRCSTASWSPPNWAWGNLTLISIVWLVWGWVSPHTRWVLICGQYVSFRTCSVSLCVYIHSHTVLQ